MIGKLLLNTLYTLGIVLTGIAAYWGYTHQTYILIPAALFTGVVLVMLKIKLLKKVKNTQKP